MIADTIGTAFIFLVVMAAILIPLYALACIHAAIRDWLHTRKMEKTGVWWTPEKPTKQ